MSLRLTALDYLSQITTHLRKFALKSQAEGEQEKLKLVVEKLLNTKECEDVPVIEVAILWNSFHTCTYFHTTHKTTLLWV